jgi:DNA-binding SARP family transcriptional activator
VLDFRILGPLEVTDEAGPLDLGGRGQRALLALMLLEPGRFVSFDQLPAEARTYVSELQKTLGDDVLEQTPDGCRLRLRSGQIDVDRFRVLLDASDRGPPALRAQKLRHALALWRGPALAEFADEPFARQYIAELHELRRAAETRLERAP